MAEEVTASIKGSLWGAFSKIESQLSAKLTTEMIEERITEQTHEVSVESGECERKRLTIYQLIECYEYTLNERPIVGRIVSHKHHVERYLDYTHSVVSREPDPECGCCEESPKDNAVIDLGFVGANVSLTSTCRVAEGQIDVAGLQLPISMAGPVEITTDHLPDYLRVLGTFEADYLQLEYIKLDRSPFAEDVDQFEEIIVSREARVLTIQLNRPEVMNAMSQKIATELNTALAMAQEDTEIGCVVLKGSDRAFCSGIDVKQGVNIKPSSIDAIEKPIVALVSGVAAGFGAELALMCDEILMTENARLMFPEVNLGWTPSLPELAVLTRAVGSHRAFRLTSTGGSLNAEECQQSNIANVFAYEEIDEAAENIAKDLSNRSPAIIGSMKRTLAQLDESFAIRASFDDDQFTAFRKADTNEVFAAFIEKRDSDFQTNSG